MIDREGRKRRGSHGNPKIWLLTVLTADDLIG
jgi:hypothetical protein